MKFEISKPSDWTFTPPAWSPVAQLQNSTNPISDWIASANLPFCCAVKHHDSRTHAYPTLQATCRPSQVPDNAAADRILNQTIDLLTEQYDDFTVTQATSAAIISGFRANIIRAGFLLPVQPDDEIIWLSVLNRTFQIFSPGRVITLGLSSSADAAYYDESEFDSIIASVRIGH